MSDEQRTVIQDPHVGEFGTDHPRGYPPPGVIPVRPKLALEAAQLTDGANWDAIAAWCGGEVHPATATCSRRVSVPGSPPGNAFEGEWIVRGIRAFMVFDGPGFAAAYGPADEPDMVTRLRMIADQEIGASAPNLAAALHDVATRIERRAELASFTTPEIQARADAFAAECDAEEAASEPLPAPPLPPGEYARVEIKGHDSVTGWVTDGTRAGTPVMVVSDWDGRVKSEVPGSSLHQFVPLPTPQKRPEQNLALTHGYGWGDGWAGSDPDGEFGDDGGSPF